MWPAPPSPPRRGRIEALQEQAAEAKDDKEKIEQRIAEIRADYDRRSAQLEQTRELSEDALAA
jgi:hypothetical protein